MAKAVWALDLGDWSIKVARGHYDNKSGNIVLELYDQIRYDMLDVEEDATTMEKYRLGLEAFAESYTVSPSDDLCVAVSGSEVFNRFINLPPVPESIAEIITYEARQQIPFDIDDVVWDYQPLKEEHQPGEEIEVGLFALKRETIDEFMDLLEPWRQNLSVIQDGPLALYNFMVFEQRTEDPVAVLDMGARSTDVLVVNHPQFWIRPLLIGADSITERVQSHFGVSWAEAERIKERASEREREAQLLRVVRPVVGNMLSEIQRSLGYYKSLSKEVRIEKVLAVGNAFKLKGLDKVLSDGLQYDIETLSDLNNFDLEASIDADDFWQDLGGATTVLGLLVQGVGEGHIGINLVPEELASARALQEKKPCIAGAVAALILIVAVLWGAEMMYSNKLTGKLDAGTGVIDRVKQLGRKYDRAETKAEETTKKVKSLAGRTTDRDMLLEIVAPVARALPDERVYVENMEFVWMSEEDFEKSVGKERLKFDSGSKDSSGAGTRRSTRSPRRSGRGSRRPSGGSDRGDGEYSRPTGLGKGAGAVHGDESILVMKLSCESTVVRRAMEYVENEIVAPLQKTAYAADGSNIFRHVYQVGRPKNIFRDSRTGKLVSSRGEDRDVIQFVAFDILAQVNVGAKSQNKGAQDADE